MKIFGIGIVTMVVLLFLGYMAGVMFPGLGNAVKSKIGG